ncbi:aldo/keto reductase [Streptomyces sp. NPDC045456]|uniref:aldo/keto reductase n=1 Tax=Streptomyces sp. NPDC045456 TaxID=3155254 RepID=UPI0033CD06DE
MTNKALTVPAVALGTWAWGDSEAGDGYFGSPLSESGLREVVEKARSNGLTLWDTAVAYGMGRSGTVLAQALTGHHRSEYQLSTKFTPQIAGEEIAELEALADAADIDTRGWWEHEM